MEAGIPGGRDHQQHFPPKGKLHHKHVIEVSDWLLGFSVEGHSGLHFYLGLC